MSVPSALTEASPAQLLEWSKPASWQRLVKALGWPAILGLDIVLAARVGVLGGQVHPALGTVAGVLTFVCAVPFLVGLISTITGLGRYAPREELRQRLGQGHKEGLIRRVLAELVELDPGQLGWIAIARGAVVGEDNGEAVAEQEVAGVA